jgi:hypothetical protein
MEVSRPRLMSDMEANSMNQSGVNKKISCGWYWAACVILALTAIAHTGAILSGSPPPENADQAALQKLLETVQLKLPGANRTTHDLLVGFNWFFTLFFAAMCVSSIVMRRARRDDAALIRTVAGVNAFLLAPGLVVSLLYFFLIPTAMIAAAMICFIAAFVSLARS